jgi:hypothetical protein
MTPNQTRKLSDRIRRLEPGKKHLVTIEWRIVEPGKLHEPGELHSRQQVWSDFPLRPPEGPGYRHWRRNIG